MIQRPASQGGASASQRLLPCVVMFCWHRASPLGKPTSYWKQNHFMFQFIVICLCFSDWGIKYVLFWRLRKDLKSLFVVHPAWYVRALITVIKPFIRWAQMIISLANRAKKGHTHYSYLKPSVWTICFSLEVRNSAGRCASSTACKNWQSLFLWPSCKSQTASDSECPHQATLVHCLRIII